MNIFNKKIQFDTPDPYGDGLREAMEAEQREPEAFDTLEDVSEEDLTASWNKIVKDIEKDPDWFTFEND